MSLIPNYEKALATEIIPSLKENLKTTPRFGIGFAWIVKEMGPEFEKYIDEDGGLISLYCNIKSVLEKHGIFAHIELKKSDYSLVLSITEESELPSKVTEDDCLKDFIIFMLGKENWENMSQQPKFK